MTDEQRRAGSCARATGRRTAAGRLPTRTLIVAVAVTVAGCARVDPAIYEPMYAQAEAIGVESAGPVLAVLPAGTGGFSSFPPNVDYVIGGCDAYDRLAGLLAAAGYTEYREAEGAAAGVLRRSWWSPDGRFGPTEAFIVELEPDRRVLLATGGHRVDLDGCATKLTLHGGPAEPDPTSPGAPS